MQKKLCSLLMAVSLPGVAQHHAHSEGKAFIAEQDGTWQIVLTLSAHDVFGFEHKPESRIEKHRVRSFVKQAKDVTELLAISGSCQLDSQELVLPQHMQLAEAEHHDDEEHHGHDDEDHHDHEEEHHGHDDADHHDHEEEAHHGHDDADHHDHEEEEHHGHDDEDHEEGIHGDVELTYTFSCNSQPGAIDFTLLRTLPSLQTLEAQWFTAAGQGAKTLSAEQFRLDW